jgi:hypothetical protein
MLGNKHEFKKFQIVEGTKRLSGSETEELTDEQRIYCNE